MPKDILIIGDAHAKPGVSNRRFSWAGRWAADKQPDYIVDMGDWADMESLCSYDEGKKSFEGRRYSSDVQAAVNARSLFQQGIRYHDERDRQRHRPLYRPTLHALGGNHCEGRISRVLEEDPRLIGTIGIGDLGYEQYGWNYTPFKSTLELQGVTLSHYFASGVMGRPIGGEMPALSLIRKLYTTAVAAHSHVFDIVHRTRPDGSRLWGIVAGCYLDEEQVEQYARGTSHLWWRGLILLKGVENGDFESIETITVQQLRRLYG